MADLSGQGNGNGRWRIGQIIVSAIASTIVSISVGTASGLLQWRGGVDVRIDGVAHAEEQTTAEVRSVAGSVDVLKATVATLAQQQQQLVDRMDRLIERLDSERPKPR